MDDLGLVIKEASQAVKAHNFTHALDLLTQNLNEDPDHIDSVYLAAVCSRYMHSYDRAEDYLIHLLKLAPDMGRVYQELGHLKRAIGDIETAIDHYRQACERNPGLLASWQVLFEFYKHQNNSNAAAHVKEKIDRLNTLPPTLLHVTQILHEGRLAEAEELCRKFLQQNPKNTAGMSLLADIAGRLGYLGDAEFLLESAVAFSPEDNELRLNYMLLLRKKQDFEASIEQAKILCDRFPDNLSYRAQMAIEMMQNGDYEQAIEIFDSVLAIAPKDPNTLTSKAHALKTFGNNEAAIQNYRAAYESKPDHGEAYFSLANLKTYTFTSQEVALMEAQIDRPELPQKDRAYFHFAMAHAYEKEKRYDDSIHHLKQGNLIKRQQSSYSIKRMTQEMDAHMDVCTPAFFETHKTGGCDATDPIFIVGLPRAGSTLIEQILASHSQVDGTLELPNILTLAQSLRGQDRLSGSGNYPEVLKTLSTEKRMEMGEAYINDTRLHRSGAPHFTDKMPNNFRHIGLIHLILPNAKIIDARRAPLDCCFSAFKQLFAQGQEFSYGLEELGAYYRDYIRLMEHWDNVLPGKVLRVLHEDVINDLEGQVQRMLDHLNLPFEEQCISFHENRRSVRTASSEQVRKPINTDGVGKWKSYAKDLQPLAHALGDDLISPENLSLILSERE